MDWRSPSYPRHKHHHDHDYHPSAGCSGEGGTCLRKTRRARPVPSERKSPDGACGRFESSRAAPPVKAGPSRPVVPGPSQAATLVLRVHWPRRPPPHRSPWICPRLDHLLSRRTHRHGPSTRQPEADRRNRPRTWSALSLPHYRRGREGACVDPDQGNMVAGFIRSV